MLFGNCRAALAFSLSECFQLRDIISCCLLPVIACCLLPVACCVLRTAASDVRANGLSMWCVHVVAAQRAAGRGWTPAARSLRYKRVPPTHMQPEVQTRASHTPVYHQCITAVAAAGKILLRSGGKEP